MKAEETNRVLGLAKEQNEKFSSLLTEFMKFKQRLLVRTLLSLAITFFVHAYYVKVGLSISFLLTFLVGMSFLLIFIAKMRFKNKKVFFKKELDFEKEQLTKIVLELSKIKTEDSAVGLDVQLKLSRANYLISKHDNFNFKFMLY